MPHDHGTDVSGSLRFVPPRASATVVALRTTGLVRRRLLDLGFVPGTTVRAVRRSPLGDPTAYRVRGTIIALRRDDADLILVKDVESSTTREP